MRDSFLFMHKFSLEFYKYIYYNEVVTWWRKVVDRYIIVGDYK